MVLRDVGDGLEGWAIAHPDFAGIEKRTETKIDNLFYYYLPIQNLVASGTSEM